MNRKIIYLTFSLFFSFQVGEAQIFKPVKWSYAAKKTSGYSAVLFLKATLEPGWHIYSAYQKDGGPSKTAFKFSRSSSFKLAGKVLEPLPTERFEKAFDMTVHFFEKETVFQQKIDLKTRTATIKGSVEYMACNDEKCLPPETISFAIPVK